MVVIGDLKVCKWFSILRLARKSD